MRVFTKKKLGICLLSLLLGFIIAAFSFVTYAYFSKKEIYDGYISGQVELLFDRLNEDGLNAYSEAEGITADKNADWGTEANPYVISNARHLYNLSELQNLGYFKRKHLANNTETDLTHIPYFLICTPDYTPVLVDGSQFRAISPIGNDENPFIGSVKGVTGSPMVTVGKNTCDTSVIHGISIKGNPKDADAGLFGHIGFLGTPPEEGTEDTTFLGTPSVVSNMVLSDVTVSVDSSLWDAIESFIVDIAKEVGGHRYSYTDLYDENDTTVYDSVPHENHHIGILAGHVSYSTVEYISVFYSSGDVVAIDLSDVTDIDDDGEIDSNYLSAAGIMGFIYNLNPSFDEGTGEITAGSGDSIGDLSYSMVGGGGLQSGSKAGYVLASNMYKAYGYTAANTPINDGAALNISKATDKDGNSLCHEWIRDNIFGLGTTATGEYYFYDGVFTFALSTQDDVIDDTWEDGVPEFSIGGTDASDWHANTSEGNKSVSAYIKQIKSDADLQTAIDSNTPLVIMKEVDSSSVVLMSLYYQSEAGAEDNDLNFNERYTTTGTSKKYATDEEIAALIESFYGSEESKQDFIDGFGEGFDEAKVEEILGHLQNEEDDETWKVISLNATSGNLTTDELEGKVEELRLEYKILSTNKEDTYSYFAGSTPVVADENGASDYYEYTEYDGYFFYTVSTVLWWQQYQYYWQPLDGSDAVALNTNASTNGPDDFFTIDANNETWHDENLYTYNDYKGIVVNSTDGEFYTTGTTANANGAILTKSAGTTIEYFYRPVGSNNCYHVTNSGLAIPVSSLQMVDGKESGAGLPYYTYTQDSTTYEGILLDRFYVYQFFSNGIDASTPANSVTNYLRMIKATTPYKIINITVASATEYTLWNGSDSEAAKTENFVSSSGDAATKLENSTFATVKFNPDGTCYIQYSIGNVSQYVNYNGGAFNTALSASDGTKLSIYSLEATQALNYGRITFDPNEETDSNSFRADEYVFWPEDLSVDVATEGTESSITEGVNTEYSVIKLETLAWNNGTAGVLSGSDLTKKFHMIDGITFGATIDIGGTIGTSGLIRAPVGTAGTETDIPSGCIAFRVNKTSTEAQKIRVVLAVPASELYVGEEGYDLGDYTRYFCLWEMKAAGDSWYQIFNASDYIERFAIPRSHPYEPGTASDSPNSEYVTVTYDEQEYRSYLNGDRVLVAYEFKVYNAGVYVLGTSTSTSDSGNIFGEKDVAPMEIVYFSADGVASTGRDGLSGSQLGTVDYVYSYNDVIVPVSESSSTDAEGNEDYTTFYPSYCMLYMNSVLDASAGTFVNVNSEKVYIRRYITDEDPPTSTDGYTSTTSKAVIEFLRERDKYARVTQYSRIADNVKERN